MQMQKSVSNDEITQIIPVEPSASLTRNMDNEYEIGFESDDSMSYEERKLLEELEQHEIDPELNKLAEQEQQKKLKIQHHISTISQIDLFNLNDHKIQELQKLVKILTLCSTEESSQGYQIKDEFQELIKEQIKAKITDEILTTTINFHDKNKLFDDMFNRNLFSVSQENLERFKTIFIANSNHENKDKLKNFLTTMLFLGFQNLLKTVKSSNLVTLCTNANKSPDILGTRKMHNSINHIIRNNQLTRLGSQLVRSKSALAKVQSIRASTITDQEIASIQSNKDSPSVSVRCITSCKNLFNSFMQRFTSSKKSEASVGSSATACFAFR